MSAADLVVIVAGVALSGFLAWFFFGPKKARQAELVGQVQEVHVTVKGGYSPDLIRVWQKVTLRIVFDRATVECWRADEPPPTPYAATSFG